MFTAAAPYLARSQDTQNSNILDLYFGDTFVMGEYSRFNYYLVDVKPEEMRTGAKSFA